MKSTLVQNLNLIPQSAAAVSSFPCAPDVAQPAEGNKIITFNFTINNAIDGQNLYRMDLTPFYSGNIIKSVRSVSVDLIADSIGDGQSLHYLNLDTSNDMVMLGIFGTVGATTPEAGNRMREVIASANGYIADYAIEFNAGGNAGAFRVQVSFANFKRTEF